MKRNKALKKIRTAYETGQLGFQKGADSCLYYCSDTKSHCAIGVLVGKKKSLMNSSGDIDVPLKGGNGIIAEDFDALTRDTFHGFNKEECTLLQNLHDKVVNSCGNSTQYLVLRFESYLYSL